MYMYVCVCVYVCVYVYVYIYVYKTNLTVSFIYNHGTYILALSLHSTMHIASRQPIMSHCYGGTLWVPRISVFALLKFLA